MKPAPPLPESDLLGFTGVDILVAPGLSEILDGVSLADILGLSTPLQNSDFSGLLGVTSLGVFFRDLTPSCASGLLGQRGLESLVVFLSFGESFSNLGFLAFIGQTCSAVPGCGSGLLSRLLLSRKWLLMGDLDWDAEDFFFSGFLSFVVSSAQEVPASSV